MTIKEHDRADVEVIAINDIDPSENENVITPHERMVVDDVIAIWKQDPETETLSVKKLFSIVKARHPNWSIAEKRLRSYLKKFGLMPNTAQEQYTYVNEITSQETPDIVLPPKIHIVMTSKRGKGLYAKNDIRKGDFLWEEDALFFIPPLSKVSLVKNGLACSYCAHVLDTSEGNILLNSLDCNVCPEVWCSQKCKTLSSQMHALLKHGMYLQTRKLALSLSSKVDLAAFLELQDYCLEEQWNALYAVALIYVQCLLDKSGIKKSQFRAMARVSQDVRYKALNSLAGSFDSMQGGALFVEEQQEQLWHEGYAKLQLAFPGIGDSVSYSEFLFMMGTYNINNVDSCIYLTQSHLNHNCLPNISIELSRELRTDKLKAFAARDIRSGEELTTSYVNPAHTVQQRQRQLRVNWGFICKCEKCKLDLVVQERRKSSHEAQAENVSDVRKMLAATKLSMKSADIDLEVPSHPEGTERRKSVRFDETVIAVKK